MVGLVIVFAIAITVGVVVYRLSGSGSAADDVTQWAGAGTPRAPRPAPRAAVRISPETTIPLVTADRSWHARVNGVLGLAVAIGIGAGAIAFAVCVLGALIARLLTSATGT